MKSAEKTRAIPLTPICDVTTPYVGTAAAAAYLNRKPQTLRNWHCSKRGPLTPRSINGRLAWPVTEIRRVMGQCCEGDRNVAS